MLSRNGDFASHQSTNFGKMSRYVTGDHVMMAHAWAAV
jgi:hypothetical protein